jgi:hypothetical protein
LISDIVISRVDPIAGGESFGRAGAYERVDGTFLVSVDPNNRANEAVTDIALAPRDARGYVQAKAPFAVLRPKQAGLGNGRLLFDVPNRGRRVALRFFNGAPDQPQSRPIEPGNGFLMRHGYTVLWCGWQHDVPDTSGNMGIELPRAMQSSGAPVEGPLRVPFCVNAPVRERLLSDREHHPYPAADLHDQNATLTVRPFDTGPQTTIPRDQWLFARDVDGSPVANPEYVFLSSGFVPGAVYEVTYTSDLAPVLGMGLLAMRDFVSYLRNTSPEDQQLLTDRVEHAFAFGASQSGRLLRRFLIAGLNIDESGRSVFDGVIAHIAGGGSGEFNQRFGQPSSSAKHSIGSCFPFHDVPMSDDEGGPAKSILDRQHACGSVPKIFLTNSSTEYWRGDAALTHVSLNGAQDVSPSDHVRNYHFAGTQHVSGKLPLTNIHATHGKVQFALNPIDYAPLLRAALLNLDAWVSNATPPPPSKYPRLADGTLQPLNVTTVALNNIPGVVAPEHVAPVKRLDFGADSQRGIVRWPAKVGAPYPLLTPSIDADGNELGGIRLPDLSVPVGVGTGWNRRHGDHGAPEQLVTLAGAFFPFPATAAQRKRNADPRQSIAERYAGRDDYLAQTHDAALRLVEAGYVLMEDVPKIVEYAGARYDSAMSVASNE